MEFLRRGQQDLVLLLLEQIAKVGTVTSLRSRPHRVTELGVLALVARVGVQHCHDPHVTMSQFDYSSKQTTSLVPMIVRGLSIADPCARHASVIESETCMLLKG